MQHAGSPEALLAATNPAALRQAMATQGESLARGLANLLGDVQKKRISQSDEARFEVGRNLGVTPGDVVFENELIQLIQYRATTAKVAARPLVMNLLSSVATVVGGVLGYYSLQVMQGLETWLLGIVAASMIYVAVADLIPGLHRRPEFRDGATQTVLIALGIGCIALVRVLVSH